MSVTESFDSASSGFGAKPRDNYEIKIFCYYTFIVYLNNEIGKTGQFHI
jgi:hypothetical protein